MSHQGLTTSQIKSNRAKLAKLIALPLVPQKSPEWYALRETMITASDFAQALGQGKFGTQKDLIKKKCNTGVDNFKSNMFFKWGNLFEPVACELYSMMHGNIKIHEFGLIQHPTHRFFGASPDGISDIGIMVEIKCPLRRKIMKGGDVPTQYYYQIQGQLDVCDLNDCDYFECEFEKTAVEELDDEVHVERWRGALIDFEDDAAYSDIIAPGDTGAAAKLQQWVQSHKPGNVIYWSLAVFNEKRVNRDKSWVEEKLQELSRVWDKILYFRQNPEKMEFELERCINIDTEEAFPSLVKKRKEQTPKTQGYAFRDMEEDT